MRDCISIGFGTTVLALQLVACGSPAAPDGLSCEAMHDAGGGGSELATALAAAGRGDCVLLGSTTYTGSFVVPAGVTVAGAKGERAEVEGDGVEAGAFVLSGSGAGLRHLRVVAAERCGVVITTPTARLEDVAVTQAAAAAVAVNCTASDCFGDDASIVLADVSIDASHHGLWISGGRVSVNGGSISDIQSRSLGGGFGLTAAGGVKLDLDGTTIADSDYGVIVDGNQGTVVRLHNAHVLRSRERGIWAQHLRGTVAAPALEVSGDDTLVEGNALVGLGAVDSMGIIIINGRIRDTVAKPASISGQGTAEIGDGIGLFAGTGETRLDGVTLENNARAQMLVDDGRLAIIIINGHVLPQSGRYKVVVQSTAVAVDVPSELLSTDAPLLPVSALELAVSESLP